MADDQTTAADTIARLDAATEPKLMAEWLRALAEVRRQAGEPNTARRLRACSKLMQDLADG